LLVISTESYYDARIHEYIFKKIKTEISDSAELSAGVIFSAVQRFPLLPHFGSFRMLNLAFISVYVPECQIIKFLIKYEPLSSVLLLYYYCTTTTYYHYGILLLSNGTFYLTARFLRKTVTSDRSHTTTTATTTTTILLQLLRNFAVV
jgi:hypothetical protein